MADQQARPRFGTLTRRDGTTIPLVFHATTEPAVFVGRHADDEQPGMLGPGDTLRVDVIGAGQSVVLEMPHGTGLVEPGGEEAG